MTETESSEVSLVFPNVSLIKSILMFWPIIWTTPGQTATHIMTREYRHLKAHYLFSYIYKVPMDKNLCWYKSSFYEFNMVTYTKKA